METRTEDDPSNIVMFAALTKGLLRASGWLSRAYLGFWLALILDRVLVQAIVYRAIGAKDMDWMTTPFRASVFSSSVVSGTSLLSAYAATLLLPLLMQVALICWAVRGRTASTREASTLGVLLLQFAVLWTVLFLVADTAAFAVRGFGYWGDVMQIVVGARALDVWVRIGFTAIMAGFLLYAGARCTAQLMAAAQVDSEAWLPRRGQRLVSALLLLGLPVILILWGTVGFNWRGFGARTTFSFLVPAVFCLLLAVLNRPGISRAAHLNPLRIGSLALSLVLAAGVYTGLASAGEWRTRIAEQRLERLATEHYEILYDPAAFPRETVEALGAERERILARLAARLGADADEVRIRLILYPSFIAKRAATRNDRAFTVSGNTIRAVLHGYVQNVDPAADATALLQAKWGEPGSAVVGGWVARWLANEYRGRPLEDAVAQIGRARDAISVADLLNGAPDGMLSPLVREPLGAAWIGRIHDEFAMAGVRKVYAAGASEPTLDPIATHLGTSPERMEAAWKTKMLAAANGTTAAAIPRQSVPEGIFFRGVTFSHEGFGSRRGGYDSPEAIEQLRRIRAVGANAISVIPYGFMPDVAATTISYLGPSTDETDEELTQALFLARQHGLKVMLKPQIWVGGGGFTGRIRFDDPAARSRWMRSYREFVLHYAHLAEQEGFDILCIGNELEGMTVLEGDWRKLIADVRRIYHGPITYAANWGTEFETLRFWDALDLAGLNNYYPLVPLNRRGGIASAVQPREISRGAQAIAARLDVFHQRHRQPILLTEVGYPSVRGAASEPWVEARARGIDLEEQAQSYEALFVAFAERPWLRGMFWWKWPSHGRGGGPQDPSFTPLGKPAADVLRTWYARMANGTGAATATSP
jgi:hypothetical protein